MEPMVMALLFAAGVVGGVVNAIAGGATLITFPAMLAASLPPVVANASNAVAISPGHLLAAVADREKLPAANRRLALSLAAATLGGIAGALLLLALPEAAFLQPVPLLIALATALFASRIQAWAARRREGAAPNALAGTAALTAVSVYGGFFGAGLGVMLSALLAIEDPDDIRRVKVMKNLLATAVSLAAIAIFIARGTVHWQATLAMLAGALPGGWAGGQLVRVLPAQAVRRVVIAAGLFMSAYYAARIWF
ncbi:sulfite exporter TauE/SafE family protein [Variovorax sp.]|uniref:sulfite exporter TauE/SafE family protein n=1 Tax=Variovorax sp. TaxID=1871043 RepID=UPI001384D883|nr:sulfite exporter TauE/SafE family protein [Variovorax sp.]KAF1068714.1 MAG: putative membrane transporter protein YfcA [Variovorax sp.]